MLTIMAIIGLVVIASSQLTNKTAKTQSTRASETYTGSCLKFPPIDNPYGKWMANCDATCGGGGDTAECKSKLNTQDVTWCYGFSAESGGNKCMKLVDSACQPGVKKGSYCDTFTTPGKCFLVDTHWSENCEDDYRDYGRSRACDCNAGSASIQPTQVSQPTTVPPTVVPTVPPTQPTQYNKPTVVPTISNPPTQSEQLPTTIPQAISPTKILPPTKVPFQQSSCERQGYYCMTPALKQAEYPYFQEKPYTCTDSTERCFAQSAAPTALPTKIPQITTSLNPTITQTQPDNRSTTSVSFDGRVSYTNGRTTNTCVELFYKLNESDPWSKANANVTSGDLATLWNWTNHFPVNSTVSLKSRLLTNCGSSTIIGESSVIKKTITTNNQTFAKVDMTIKTPAEFDMLLRLTFESGEKTAQNKTCLERESTANPMTITISGYDGNIKTYKTFKLTQDEFQRLINGTTPYDMFLHAKANTKFHMAVLLDSCIFPKKPMYIGPYEAGKIKPADTLQEVIFRY